MGTLIFGTVPVDLGTLALWHDYSDASSMKSGTSGPPPTDGQNVGYMTDKSGNAYDTQALGPTERPTFKTGVLNGQSGLLFNGTSNRPGAPSNGTLTSDRAALTIYSVVKWSAIPTGREVVLRVAVPGVSIFIEIASSGVTPGKLRIYGKKAIADTPITLEGITTLTTGAVVITSVWDWASAKMSLYLNGTLEASTSSFFTAGNSENAARSLFIGASGGSGFFNGYQFEHKGYWKAHGPAERAAVLATLNTKYGL